jgi:hypothetical protein
MTDVPVETGNTPVLGLDDIKQLADLIIADVKDR